MFKAPIKVLHPLLTATQEGNFKGTEGFGAIPFDGVVLAHSNESEWKAFRNNKNNEAFLDRIYIVKVPYCLRVSEEVKIYEKLLRSSRWRQATCAPGTLKMMSQFAILTRLKEPENSSLFSKMQVYDGENLKDTDPRAKSYQEYRDYAGVDEGMSGISTRFAYKILSKVFNFDSTEVAANPVHLMYVLEQQIEREQFPAETGAEVHRLHQGAAGAALRRVHRQGDPDRLPGELFRVRPEHLRPLRHLRRLLDPGPGVPRHRHRRGVRPRQR
jgi:serine protein kinase